MRLTKKKKKELAAIFADWISQNLNRSKNFWSDTRKLAKNLSQKRYKRGDIPVYDKDIE